MNKKPVVDNVTPGQLENFLVNNGTSHRFIGFTLKTEVKKLKKGHPFGGPIFKLKKHRGSINADYAAGVNRRIAAKLEAAGVPSELVEVKPYVQGKSSYTHLQTPDGKPLPVMHKASGDDGERFLQFTPDENFRSPAVYVDVCNNVIANETIEPWIQVSPPRPDFKPPVISPKLSSIVELRASGLILQTEEAAETLALL